MGKFKRFTGKHHQRRVRTRVAALPAPISRSVERPGEHGEVLRWLAPAKGEVKNIQVRVGKLANVKSILALVAIERGDGTKDRREFEARGNFADPGPYEIGAGDLVTVRAMPIANKADEPATLEQIDVAFLFDMNTDKRARDEEEADDES